MAEASLFVHNLEHTIYAENIEPMLSHINVGTGVDVTIRELAKTIKEVIGFNGELIFDESKPDGTPRKLMHSGLVKKLGWKPTVSLIDGVKLAYNGYILDNKYNTTSLLKVDIQQ
jgi:GDP-L-fucose synthase